jgi:hypothetical protein
MNLRTCFVHYACRLILSSAAVVIGPLQLHADVLLAVPNEQQGCDYDCWAAVTDAVLQYYGTPTPRASIKAYGNTCNPCGTTNICTPAGCYSSIPAILFHFGAIAQGSCGDFVAPLDTLRKDFYWERPLFVRWYMPATGMGHAIVLTGVSDAGAVRFMEPKKGTTQWSSYDWFVNGADQIYGTHQWTHSVRLATVPPYNPGNQGTIGGAMAIQIIMGWLLF